MVRFCDLLVEHFLQSHIDATGNTRTVTYANIGKSAKAGKTFDLIEDTEDIVKKRIRYELRRLEFMIPPKIVSKWRAVLSDMRRSEYTKLEPSDLLRE